VKTKKRSIQTSALSSKNSTSNSEQSTAVPTTGEFQNRERSNLKFLKEIGNGSYGRVYKGLWRGQDVAIKESLDVVTGSHAALNLS